MASEKPKPPIESWKNVELSLGSRGRLRILRKLASEGLATQHRLIKSTGLKTKELKRQLEILLNTGWVEATPHNPKKYRINRENEFAKRIAELLKATF